MQAPRLPLRPPTQLESRHRPETQKHRRLARRLRSATPGTAEAAAISCERHFPGQHHARRRPAAAAAATSALLAMQVCVLKWNSNSGKLRPQGQQGRIADQHGIDAALPGQFQDPRRLAELPLGQIDVQRQIRPWRRGVDRFDRPGEFVLA